MWRQSRNLEAFQDLLLPHKKSMNLWQSFHLNWILIDTMMNHPLRRAHSDTKNRRKSSPSFQGKISHSSILMTMVVSYFNRYCSRFSQLTTNLARNSWRRLMQISRFPRGHNLKRWWFELSLEWMILRAFYCLPRTKSIMSVSPRLTVIHLIPRST